MMERFRAMFGEARGGVAPAVTRPAEQVTFERARAVMHKRSELHGFRVAFGIAGLFVAFIAIERLGPSARAASGSWRSRLSDHRGVSCSISSRS